MRALRVIFYGFVVVAALVLSVALAARYSDGPIGPFAGGPLVGGPLVTASAVDWSALPPGTDTAELQLIEPPRSRTVGFVVYEGSLYVPCYFPEFRAWKQWPHEAVRDGRAVLRVEGKRYARRAVRITDEAAYDPVHALMVEQLSAPDPEVVWIFRMDPWPEAVSAGLS